MQSTVDGQSSQVPDRLAGPLLRNTYAAASGSDHGLRENRKLLQPRTPPMRSVPDMESSSQASDRVNQNQERPMSASILRRWMQWWVMTDLNRRHLRCERRRSTTELITHVGCVNAYRHPTQGVDSSSRQSIRWPADDRFGGIASAGRSGCAWPMAGRLSGLKRFRRRAGSGWFGRGRGGHRPARIRPTHSSLPSCPAMARQGVRQSGNANVLPGSRSLFHRQGLRPWRRRALPNSGQQCRCTRAVRNAGMASVGRTSARWLWPWPEPFPDLDGSPAPVSGTSRSRWPTCGGRTA